jgi:hypothetical protein
VSHDSLQVETGAHLGILAGDHALANDEERDPVVVRVGIGAAIPVVRHDDGERIVRRFRFGETIEQLAQAAVVVRELRKYERAESGRHMVEDQRKRRSILGGRLHPARAERGPSRQAGKIAAAAIGSQTERLGTNGWYS